MESWTGQTFIPRRTMPNHEPKAPSPGGHGFALPRMRCVGLPATRTRTASKHALSRPFVPERRIAEGHVVRSSVISAGSDTSSGSRLRVGRPGLDLTGSSSTSAGYIKSIDDTPTAQASPRAPGPAGPECRTVALTRVGQHEAEAGGARVRDAIQLWQSRLRVGAKCSISPGAICLCHARRVVGPRRGQKELPPHHYRHLAPD